MMKSAFKVMDTCLWYIDSGCLRHMTGDCSLFKVFESKKGGNVTFGDESKSQIKGKGTISLPGLPDITNVLYVEGLKVNLLSISQICDQDFMVLFSKGKCLVLNKSGEKHINRVRTLDNCYGLVPEADIVFNSICRALGRRSSLFIHILGLWPKLRTRICLRRRSLRQRRLR